MGNFVVTTKLKDAGELAGEFSGATDLQCIAVSLSQLYWCVGKVRELTEPTVVPEIRWTPGAAFRLRGRRQYFEPFSTARGEFQCISTDIVGVQKRDNLTESGPVDSARRHTWGAASTDIGERLGGVWIARSWHSLHGALLRALMYLDR